MKEKIPSLCGITHKLMKLMESNIWKRKLTGSLGRDLHFFFLNERDLLEQIKIIKKIIARD